MGGWGGGGIENLNEEEDEEEEEEKSVDVCRKVGWVEIKTSVSKVRLSVTVRNEAAKRLGTRGPCSTR